ncbi:MAG: ABC transporter ATP-binding protein [Candidatus Omnitrophota bacterium]
MWKKSNIGQVLLYLRPYKRNVAIAWGLLLLNILMQLPMPLITMYLIDHVVASKKLSTLHLLAIGLFLFLILQSITTFMQRSLIIKIQGKIVTQIRLDLCRNLLSAPLKYFNSAKVGDLITRITSDVAKLEGLLATTFVSFLTESLTLLVGIIILMFLHFKLAIVSLLIVPFYLFTIKFFRFRLKDASEAIQKELSGLASALFEGFLSIFFVRAFGTEKVELERMGTALDNTYKAKLKSDILNSLALVSADFIGSLGRFILIWYGLSEVIRGSLTVGGFLAFNSFLRYIYDPSRNLMNLNATIHQSAASLDRVNQLIEDTEKNEEKDGKIELTEIKGKLEFDGVSFGYNSERGAVLKNINFCVEPSQSIAIVGPNGAGKSTLINLILRLYHPDSGIIRLDDTNITHLKGQWLRSQIGFVPQDIYLLSNTLAYNISYGTPSTSLDDIMDAAKKADAHEFIMKLPDGYQTMVGERGTNYNFSGGEKQRISIARAFLKNPKILIFDEALSSIDNESSVAIQKALQELMQGKTSFIVAHRLSTVVNADQILVFDGGNLVQSGPHRALVEIDGLYKRLYEKEYFKELA